MPLFDFYIMVDWSGGARRRGGRSDAIWIAHGPRTYDTPLTNSPHSRTEAIELIEPVLERAIRSKQRVLLCFDFAYGYPVDFAPALQAATGKTDRDLPWSTVWQYLSGHLKDDEGTTPGAKPSNRSNRFEVADCACSTRGSLVRCCRQCDCGRFHRCNAVGDGLQNSLDALAKPSYGQRRETVEHPFGTLKMRMGATHFLMKRLPKVATEMALHVLARVMNIMGIQPLMAAIRA